jgi:hypothetical protein
MQWNAALEQAAGKALAPAKADIQAAEQYFRSAANVSDVPHGVKV